MLKITSNHLAPLKTRDIPTLTNPHLPLSNNGYNPPLSARSFEINQLAENHQARAGSLLTSKNAAL
jgi:hypothetical protein